MKRTAFKSQIFEYKTQAEIILIHPNADELLWASSF